MLATKQYQLEAGQDNLISVLMKADKRHIGDFDIDIFIKNSIEHHITTIKRLFILLDNGDAALLSDEIGKLISPNIVKRPENNNNLQQGYKDAILDAYCFTFYLDYECFKAIV